jgi:hypothetical protein
MRKRSFSNKIETIDERVNNLRKQLGRKGDPIAIGKAVACIYLDNIARILAYIDQLDRAIDYQLFDRDLTFEQDFARVSAILRILNRLTSMLLKQTDRFLKCFGGPQTIGVQQIVEWARHDAERGAWLEAFAFTMHRKRRP